MGELQKLIDMANIVSYKRPIIVNGKRPTAEDVPEDYKEDCERIMSIIKEYSGGEEITIDMAYDLWKIHSEESFCGSWECMDSVSDFVIYHNLIGLMKCIQFED